MPCQGYGCLLQGVSAGSGWLVPCPLWARNCLHAAQMLANAKLSPYMLRTGLCWLHWRWCTHGTRTSGVQLFLRAQAWCLCL